MKWSLLAMLIACSGAQNTESSSEPSSEASTEPSSEASTEPSSEASTEPSSEASTEPSSEDPIAMDVYINELVAKSDVTADWIELYNAGSSSVDVSGCTLEDSGGEPWELPAGTEIAAGGFLLIWADDGAEGEGLHAPFKLSKDGEELLFKDAQEYILDQVSSPELAAEEAYARVTDGGDEWEVRTESTPEASNN